MDRALCIKPCAVRLTPPGWQRAAILAQAGQIGLEQVPASRFAATYGTAWYRHTGPPVGGQHIHPFPRVLQSACAGR
jgi:hypothetical protein